MTPDQKRTEELRAAARAGFMRLGQNCIDADRPRDLAADHAAQGPDYNPQGWGRDTKS